MFVVVFCKTVDLFFPLDVNRNVSLNITNNK